MSISATVSPREGRQFNVGDTIPSTRFVAVGVSGVLAAMSLTHVVFGSLFPQGHRSALCILVVRVASGSSVKTPKVLCLLLFLIVPAPYLGQIAAHVDTLSVHFRHPGVL